MLEWLQIYLLIGWVIAAASAYAPGGLDTIKKMDGSSWHRMGIGMGGMITVAVFYPFFIVMFFLEKRKSKNG